MGIIAWSNFFWAPSQSFAYKNISRPAPKVKILLEIPGEWSNIFVKYSQIYFSSLKQKKKKKKNNNLNTL